MTDKPDNPFKFWEELKRRKVVRVITVYAAAAFVLLELVDIVSPSLGLPSWTLNFIIVLLCIGFIIVFLLSWIYDIGPEGIRKTKSANLVNNETRQSTSRGWKISTYFSILIIAGFVLVYIIGGIKQNSDISKLDKTIAVLPFENWSYAEENAHLGNAIANEIITELYKINEFHVISYTSSSQYKGFDKPTIPEIGRELGANFIIEGTIERQDEEVNIHVQVIQAQNDDHIWANKFEGQWKDIHEIQDEIAYKVAEVLKTVLSPDEIEKIETKPTENPEAYNYYLRGNEFFWRSYEKQDWSIAINMYERAIELDPEFALAYTMLARSHMSLYWFHHDRSREQLDISKQAIDSAFEIEPNLTDGFIALGLYYYWGFLDYPKALKYFDSALEKMPNNPECLYYKSCVYRRMGDWAKAEEGLVRAIINDPRSSRIAYNTAETFYLTGDYNKALEYLALAISLTPDFVELYRYKINIYLKWEGNTKNAWETLNDISLVINPTSHPLLLEIFVLLEIYDGRYQEAIDFLNTTNFEAIQPQFYYIPKPLLYAMIYDLEEDEKMAEQYYNMSRIALETRILDYPDDTRLVSSLGICYAGLNQKEKAIKAGLKAVEMLPISKEAYIGVYRLADLARIYVMVGEYESALEKLDYLLTIPGFLSTKLLQLDPIWKPLWDLPEFIELIEKHSDN